MKNYSQISSDSFQVKLTSFVRLGTVGVLFHMAMNITSFIGAYLLGDLLKDWIYMYVSIPFFLSVYLMTVGKFTLWNFLGKERIIITKKSVSYQRDYGLFKLPVQTYYTDQLTINYETIIQRDLIDYCDLTFYSYNSEDLPELLFESNILLPKTDVQELFYHLDLLFEKESYSPMGQLFDICLN